MLKYLNLLALVQDIQGKSKNLKILVALFMFFRRSFARSREHSLKSSGDSREAAATANNNYENHNNSDTSSGSPMRRQPATQSQHRHSSKDRYLKSVNVIQLTPLWEYIIRTRKLPDDVNVAEVFDEFLERLHDPEWQVRQHALRVLIDLLLVMGDEADVYFSPLIPPLIENLGHDAPAIRKASLDALRIYIANTIMPETVMLEILDQGLERQQPTLSGARYTIGVILSIPSLIQPVLLTPKRSFIIRSVFNVLEKKMLQIQYQEIVLKVLLKVKEMIGEKEFNASLPVLMKRDFELLCKVYSLEMNVSDNKKSKTLEVNAESKINKPREGSSEKPWTYTVEQSNRDSSKREVSFNLVPDSDCDSSDTNNNKFGASSFVEVGNDTSAKPTPSTTKKSVNFDQNPKRYDYKIYDYKSQDGHTDVVTTITDPKTKQSFSARSRSGTTEIVQQRPASHTSSSHGSNMADDTDASSVGKVIMETEIKLSKDTAVTMRIFETPIEENDSANLKEESVQFELDIDGLDEDAPKEVNINVIKATENLSLEDVDGNSEDGSDPRTSRRVTFGGELIKMRTPDSDALEHSDTNMEHSDNDGQSNTTLHPNQKLSSTSQSSGTLKSQPSRQDSFEYDSDRSTRSSLPEKTPAGYQKPLEIKIPDYFLNRPYTAGLRPSTSSPAIFTIPPTSSSDASDHYEHGFSPRIFSPCRHGLNRSKSATPQRSASRRNSAHLIEKLSPQAREVQMIHNLARSPVNSPTRMSPSPTHLEENRQPSPQVKIPVPVTLKLQRSPQKLQQSNHLEFSYQQSSHQQSSNQQPSYQQSSYQQSDYQQASSNINNENRGLLNEATQTSVQQTETDNTDNSSPENHTHSWESLGIISANAIQNLKSGVSC